MLVSCCILDKASLKALIVSSLGFAARLFKASSNYLDASVENVNFSFTFSTTSATLNTAL
jgi:hypothetical protein